MSKRSSPYNVHDVMVSKNVDEETAIKLVTEHKLKTSQSIDGFIFRYGEELGTIKYNEFKDKSKSTVENFKRRYGDNWEIKWDHYMSTRNTRSLTSFIERYGELEGLIRFKQSNDIWKYKMSLDYFIKQYGVDEGTLKYKSFNKSKDSASLESCISRYGNAEGHTKYHERCMKRDSSSLTFFVNKYGKDIGQKLYVIKCRNISPIFSELKRIYGVDVAIEEYTKYLNSKSSIKLNTAIDIIKHRFQHNHKNLCKSPVSKQSIKLFREIENKLDRQLNYGERKHELVLFDVENCKKYFYDCYDKKTNTIIEFNGSLFHPNESLPEIEKKEWTTLYGISFDDAMDRDTKKLNYAKKMGYSVIVIWDYEIRNKTQFHNKVKELVGILK